MKQEGFATAFERLDREIMALRRGCALGTLFAWNWEHKLTQRPSRRRGRLPSQGRARRWVWTFGRRRIELLVGALVASLALCACGPKETTPAENAVNGAFDNPGVTYSYTTGSGERVTITVEEVTR